ncbi:sterol desaturase/sphingolipid hydroxylase (fatty acid hydroxylase superfamily) [Litorivivens lipolytica]|uniref:Sterol desaturase/sphingolipid hydroxylase (Fatty acid hydroxylase superfamily) n=1 Tax=Litorivivens lipolytica TaxID=1524264 RepID=A0A7W4W4S5_9GAMM|nr:sterol desaturase family protein [Litorivivens lipolytica]MBB3047466.1 sterol desaturase/sphingolipid hydroxylase (fatty acid hydroxylase superfamily) [Litorivivens lipolytica]
MSAFENAVLFAIPGFLLLMLLEFAWSKWNGPDTWHHHADAVSSISSGLTYLVLRTLGFGVLVISYDWVAERIAVSEPIITGFWLYALVFLWKDFTSYWMHRWAHANSFLWAMHLIHHSSEEFNLAVALRQNAFNWFSYGGLMLLPLALLGVPTEVVAVVLPVQFFMQFWYHTQHVGKLGPFEYFLVTPSQHRVHHAINPQYIDKNFGQIFCWDRLFGTFQEELRDEPPAYGITTPVRHYNPVMIELNYMGRLLRDALTTRKWRDKASVFLSRTGWRPEDVKRRWPDEKLDYRDPGQKFQRPQPRWLILWAWVQFAVLLLATAYTLANIGELSVLTKTALLLFVLSGVVANSQQLMLTPSLVAEALRFVMLTAVAVIEGAAFAHWGVWLLPLLALVCGLSVWVGGRVCAPSGQLAADISHGG